MQPSPSGKQAHQASSYWDWQRGRTPHAVGCGFQQVGVLFAHPTAQPPPRCHRQHQPMARHPCRVRAPGFRPRPAHPCQRPEAQRDPYPQPVPAVLNRAWAQVGQPHPTFRGPDAPADAQCPGLLRLCTQDVRRTNPAPPRSWRQVGRCHRLLAPGGTPGDAVV
ncbi:MAG: hypothetical protein MI924_04710 [Chloroflexales bacterium]|nr:hypothetical protein [Chloroflexales bacterium]